MTTTNALSVDPANRSQLQAWDGDEGAYWAAHADHFEKALALYDAAFNAAAAVGPADRVLDVGCGTGKTTRNAARAATEGSVLGVDLSSAMLAVARQRAADEGLGNVRFEHVDAQIHPFEPEAFDVAIGCTSVTFFGDRVAGPANIGRALRPGGRLVQMTWQPFRHQEWIREFSTALAAGRDLPTPPAEAPGPFTLADPDIVRTVLDAAGYAKVTLDNQRAPMWFGTNADDLPAGARSARLDARSLDDTGRATAQEALRTTIAAHATADGILYNSATWIIRATRP